MAFPSQQLFLAQIANSRAAQQQRQQAYASQLSNQLNPLSQMAQFQNWQLQNAASTQMSCSTTGAFNGFSTGSSVSSPWACTTGSEFSEESPAPPQVVHKSWVAAVEQTADEAEIERQKKLAEIRWKIALTRLSVEAKVAQQVKQTVPSEKPKPQHKLTSIDDSPLFKRQRWRFDSPFKPLHDWFVRWVIRLRIARRFA